MMSHLSAAYCGRQSRRPFVSGTIQILQDWASAAPLMPLPRSRSAADSRPFGTSGRQSLIANRAPISTCTARLDLVYMAAQKDFWRDEGYPGFSKWMASSDDFLVLRRFGQLNVRVLLLMQDRIVRKEEELANIDAHGRLHGDDSKADSSALRKEPLPEREAILDELKTMLHEYSRYLGLCTPPI